MKLPQREGDNFKELTLDHTKKKEKNIKGINTNRKSSKCRQFNGHKKRTKTIAN